MALVIKDWQVNSTPDQAGAYVRIDGRQEGLISWILTKIGISATTSIEVYKDQVLFTAGSLEGFEHRVIPVTGICSAYYGYKKPLKEAIVLGLALLPLCGLGLLVGPLYYFLNKTLTLGFVENSGVVSGIQIKRSVIEGKKIDEEDAKRVVDIVRAILLRKS